jgi:hypothetical protein
MGDFFSLKARKREKRAKDACIREKKRNFAAAYRM